MPSKSPSQNFAYKCGVQGCVKSYPQLEHLRAHGKSHLPVKITASVDVSIKAFKCGVASCDKSFDDHKAFLQHGKLHSLNVGVNPAFKCGFSGCGESFYDHEALLQHGRMASHCAKSTKPFIITTGNKPYKCGVSGCEQRFDDHGALLSHGRTHTVCPRMNLSQELPSPSPASPYPPFDHSQTRIANPQHTHARPASRAASFFSQSENVDARHSEFNQVTGSQIFIGALHVGTSPVYLTPRSSSPPPPYQQ